MPWVLTASSDAKKAAQGFKEHKTGQKDPAREHDNIPVTNPAEMGIHRLSDTEFIATVLGKGSRRQERRGSQRNEVRKTKQEQKESNRWREIIKHQTDVLEPKNTVRNKIGNR